ncbi:aldo/keto reductase [Algoriphagus sp. AK58]|uniref:aldo/keto reductase n=1 Tax=Algoriphagus sp. AK58 TaxID=1406877 RepID=UPI0016509022|nr:aldo/keto reductase [Algoriphagus sp. AK58]MBC6368562.1 oxidoreductase [Algoriphagus sp. AK58]
MKWITKEGLNLPEIGLGCMSLPEDFGEAKSILNEALDKGITLFDTADLYQRGQNEVNLGKALRGKRQEVLIASKVGNQWNKEGTSWSWNPTKKYILKAVEESLKRLQTDYLDLYQLHGGTLDDPWEETLEAFHMLGIQGKIRAFGISSIRPNVIRKVMSMSPPKTVMMQYSPLDRRPEEEVFPFLEKTETKVLVRGAFAKGILIDKPEAGFLDKSKEQVRVIRDVIIKSGYMPEAVLIRFGLLQKAVGSLIIGASSIQQVRKLLEGYNQSEVVPEEFVDRLKADFPANRYQDHR